MESIHCLVLSSCPCQSRFPAKVMAVQFILFVRPISTFGSMLTAFCLLITAMLSIFQAYFDIYFRYDIDSKKREMNPGLLAPY